MEKLSSYMIQNESYFEFGILYHILLNFHGCSNHMIKMGKEILYKIYDKDGIIDDKVIKIINNTYDDPRYVKGFNPCAWDFNYRLQLRINDIIVSYKFNCNEIIIESISKVV